MSDNKRVVRSNYRFSLELDKLISQEADRQKLSKNALVKMILLKVLTSNNFILD